MIKLFRKLWEHRVEMKCRYALTNGRIMYVKFMSGHIGCMTRMINLDEFTDVWGGDHVLENVLEAYLDEFLGELSEGRAEIGKPNLERTVKFSGGE